MKRILDNSFKIDSVVSNENRFREQNKIFEEQNAKLILYK